MLIQNAFASLAGNPRLVREETLGTKWRKTRELGRGEHGTVVEAVNTETGAIKALKVAFKNEAAHWQSLRNEINVLQRLDHPHVMPLEDFNSTPEALVVITDVYPGGSMLDVICSQGKLSEEDARRYMRQLLEAIEHCHARSVIHRDIKLEHLLLDRPHTDISPRQLQAQSCVTLVDFGVSAVLERPASVMHEQMGSPEYIAPEVLGGSYGVQADMWSAGIVLYAMLSGYLPFQAETTKELFHNIQRLELPMPEVIWEDIDPDATELVKLLLVKNPQKRLTAADALQHSWLVETSAVR